MIIWGPPDIYTHPSASITLSHGKSTHVYLDGVLFPAAVKLPSNSGCTKCKCRTWNWVLVYIQRCVNHGFFTSWLVVVVSSPWKRWNTQRSSSQKRLDMWFTISNFFLKNWLKRMHKSETHASKKHCSLQCLSRMTASGTTHGGFRRWDRHRPGVRSLGARQFHQILWGRRIWCRQEVSRRNILWNPHSSSEGSESKLWGHLYIRPEAVPHSLS